MRKNLLLAALLLCGSLVSFAQNMAKDSRLEAKREMMKEVFHSQNFEQKTPADQYKEMENVVLGKGGSHVTTVDLQMLQKAYQGVMEKAKAKKPQRSIDVVHDNWCITKVETRDANGELTGIEEREYDNQGRLISFSLYKYAQQKPVPVSKYERTYDANGNVKAYVAYVWNQEEDQWMGYYKMLRSYNDYNVLLDREEYLYDENSGEWFLSAYYYTNYDIYGWLLSIDQKSGRTSIDGTYTAGDKVKYSYSDGSYRYLSLKLSYVLNVQTGEFDPVGKWEYGYDQDSRNKTLEAYYEMGTDNQWKGVSFKSWNYDESGNVVQTLVLNSWNDAYNTWAWGEKTENEYAGNTLTKNASYEWVPQKARFELVDLSQQEFDENGRLSLSAFVYSYWDNNNTRTISGTKSVNTFTDKGYEERTYTWDSDNQDWLASTIYVGKNDDNGRVAVRESYDPELTFLGSNTYTWTLYSYTDIYPDVYMRGTFNNWTAPEEYKMTDKGNGIVEIENVTLTDEDEFKFADSEWGQVNWGSDWGLPSDEANVYSDIKKQLFYNGGNLRLPQGSGTVICKKITLDIVNGLLLMVYSDATAVNLVAADGSTIVVEGNKIVTRGAQQVEVYQTDGKLVSRAPVTSVSPGLYVVKADSKVIKVQVK